MTPGTEGDGASERRIQSLQRELALLAREHFAVDQHAIVSVTDRHGVITDANELFCSVSGYTRDELIGRKHSILKSGRHAPEFYAQMWRTIASGNTWHGEICNRRKDGGLYWVKSSIVPLLDARGEPVEYVSIRTDVTELHQSREALRDSEERLRRSQVYANIGTWDWNIATGELYWSERIAPLFGYPAGELDTSYDNFLAAVHPQDRPRVVAAVNACLESGCPYEIEHRCVWPDGTVRWLLERGDVVRAPDGAPAHMLGVVQDITQRKEAELGLAESRACLEASHAQELLRQAELVRAKEAAEQASHAKSEFLSSMSHELRTPMNAILGFAQILGMDPSIGDKQAGYVREILGAGRHLLALINDVLNLAKLESGSVTVTVEAVALDALIGECLNLIQPLAQRYDLHLTRALSPGLTVLGDRVRLEQVLLNLLSNAVKYNRPGGEVRVRAARAEQTVRIEVEDTGKGIAPEHLSQLFKPFCRLDAEGQAIEGTGIGLSISKRLVEMMGGSMGVNSQPGKGSVFWLELPRPQPGHAPPRARSAAPPHAPAPPAAQPTRTVLYVEDNPANLNLVSALCALRPAVRLLLAPAPETGLELARKHKPDLLLLDINMPGMDGYRFLEVMRADPELSRLPVVAVTANAMQGDMQRARASGFNDYVTKPLDVANFLTRLDAWLASAEPVA